MYYLAEIHINFFFKWGHSSLLLSNPGEGALLKDHLFEFLGVKWDTYLEDFPKMPIIKMTLSKQPVRNQAFLSGQLNMIKGIPLRLPVALKAKLVAMLVSKEL